MKVLCNYDDSKHRQRGGGGGYWCSISCSSV